MSTLRSGIYKIANYSRTACMEELNTQVGCWDNGDRESLQWHIKPVAKGYLIKNCETGRYLANHERIDKIDHSAVYCGESPTVWNFDRQARDDIYLIRRQGYLHALYCESSQTIGGIVMKPSMDYSYNKWIFEHLCDNPDEEVQGENAQIDEVSTANDQQILEQTQRIVELSVQLTEKDENIFALQQQLTRQSQSLAEAKAELRQTKAALASRDAKLLAIEENTMKDELSRQKEDVSDIRARMQVMEQFMLSQMRISASTRPNNAT